ncbi:MAG: hypothetical protein ACI92W_000727 [Paraglaciecola sp.]|jgi:hypothetical protein
MVINQKAMAYFSLSLTKVITTKINHSNTT